MAVRRELMGAVALVVLVACGDNVYRNAPYFTWDDTTAIGAFSTDGLAGDDHRLLNAVDRMRNTHSVVVFYGHDRPDATSSDAIEGLFARAAHDGMQILTFADLATVTTPEAGICLSFDDTEIDAWYALRGILARYHAHVSFFVTRYAQFTPDQRAKLHVLYEDGNSIEAHGVNHVSATTYIAELGLQSYLDNEVQPSIDILRADGFDPIAYAHPYGAHTRELDEALAERIRFVRETSGSPK